MISNPDSANSTERENEKRALERAAQSARQLAARTGTPIIVSRDGKVVRISVDEAELKPVVAEKN